MKKFMAAAAIAATVVAGSALPSFAATTSSYTVSNQTGATGGASLTKGNFTASFNFDTFVAGSITASITNSLKSISNATLSIFDSMGKILASSSTIYTIPPSGAYGISAGPTLVVGPGNYTAEITGYSNKTASLAADISVSAVPLPGSVALFGTAILGLGAFGAMRRRGAAAKAV